MQFSITSVLAVALLATSAAAKSCSTASASGICKLGGDAKHWYCDHAKECPSGYTSDSTHDADNVSACVQIGFGGDPSTVKGLCVARWNCCK